MKPKLIDMKKAKFVRQTAALPIRWDKAGRLRILMVTSRDTGRWVMPKGWLMEGKTASAAARVEAVEEAGAIGFISDEKIGTYHYDKRLGDKSKVRCKVSVYPMIVEELKTRWKERDERKRKWFSPGKAAKLVNEPELSELLIGLKDKPKKNPIIKDLLKAS